MRTNKKTQIKSATSNTGVPCNPQKSGDQVTITPNSEEGQSHDGLLSTTHFRTVTNLIMNKNPSSVTPVAVKSTLVRSTPTQSVVQAMAKSVSSSHMDDQVGAGKLSIDSEASVGQTIGSNQSIADDIPGDQIIAGKRTIEIDDYVEGTLK